MNLINLFIIGAITHLSILAHHLVKHTMNCPNCQLPDTETSQKENLNRKFLLDYLAKWDDLIQANPTKRNISTKLGAWVSNIEAKSLLATTKRNAPQDTPPNPMPSSPKKATK